MSAEIGQDSGGKKKGGKVRSKKKSTKIDFTPMVDLGFLLITFFMLTTTLSKPQTMEINMPEKEYDPNDPTKVPESAAMTVILSEDDRIYYYFGFEDPKVEVTDFSSSGIRKVLLEKNDKLIQKIKEYRTQLEEKKISEEEYKEKTGKEKRNMFTLMVLIKSDDKAKYKNLVDILDEMQITNVAKYAIVDISPEELELIAAAENTAGI